MQDTSNVPNYDVIINSGKYVSEVKVSINGVDYGEDSLISVQTTKALFGENNPTFGTAISAEIDLEMLYPTETIPRMAEIIPYVRICGILDSGYSWQYIDRVIVFTNGVSLVNSILTFTQESGAYIEDSILNLPPKTVELKSGWIQKGVFRIDTRELSNSKDTIRIHGFDDMMKADQDYPSSSLTWSSNSPRERAVLDEIAAAINVELDDRTKAAFPVGSGYIVSFPAQYTMREVLCSIGAMHAGSFCMSDQGKLLFIGITDLPEETNYLITVSGNYITFGGKRILLR